MPTLPSTLPRVPVHDTIAAGTGAGAGCFCPSLPGRRGSTGEQSRGSAPSRRCLASPRGSQPERPPSPSSLQSPRFDASAPGAGARRGRGCAGGCRATGVAAWEPSQGPLLLPAGLTLHPCHSAMKHRLPSGAVGNGGHPAVRQGLFLVPMEKPLAQRELS